MPILLIFLVMAACLPVPWPNPLGLGRGASAALTAATVALAVTAAFAVRTWVVRALRANPGRRVEVARGYSRFRRGLFFLNLGLVLVVVLGLGWGKTVQDTLVIGHDTGPRLAPFAELAVPLPYFLIVFGCWLVYYDAERALHRLTIGTRPGREFWSRGGYFVHNLRQLALLVGLPVGLFVTQQSLDRIAPELTRTDAFKVASVAVVPAVVLFMPLVIKPLLGLRTMPAGPVRERLEALARRLGFRYADLLVWPTRGAAANAMIVGLVPRVRYVVFTDRLLDEMPPDELDAVFGHEVGHARHGHIWFYAAFIALSMAALAAGLVLIDQTLYAAGVRVPEEYQSWLLLPPVAVAATYIFVVFGLLSRRCERQADVFGCRAGSCANPACTGHDADTVYPPGGAGLCPTGIRAMVRGLDRVEDLNGYAGPVTGAPRTLGTLVRVMFGWLRAWQHGPIPRRVAFLRSLIDDPKKEPRFQRGVTVFRWGLVLGLVLALLALGRAVGWSELCQSL